MPIARGREEEVQREARRLVDTYGNLTMRLAFTYLGSRQDAEDVSQDVLCKLICRQRPFESPEHEKAWVIRCTANACVADQSAQVEDLVEKSELPGRVTAAVMRLSPPYREAVYLYYYEGMSIRQIARATGATEAAITKRLSRARAELRKSLEEKSDGNHDEGVSGRDGSGLSFFRKEEPDGTGRGLGRAVCD